MNLDSLLSRPGIYMISAPTHFFFVEVMAGGECHQLKPGTFERDGVLRREGWNLNGDEEAFGPLARPAAVLTRAVAHRENGGWSVRIGTYCIGRWCYRGERADREVECHVNRINMELDGKRVAAFGCADEANGLKRAPCWTGWCGRNDCAVSFVDADPKT